VRTKHVGLGVLAAAAVVCLSVVAGAQDKAKPKSACNAIKEETACKADQTCSWVAALKDEKTGKQKRRAYCKSKPKPKTKEPAKK
jgi:predicted small secreted protein